MHIVNITRKKNLQRKVNYKLHGTDRFPADKI